MMKLHYHPGSFALWLAEHRMRVSERPAVQRALIAERA